MSRRERAVSRSGNERRGLLLVDKPPDLTSHDVVARARRLLGTRRIGHTGTLDPFATGLLLLCLGAFTRMSEYFHALSKTYRAALVLGEERSTDDLTGDVTRSSDSWEGLTVAQVRAALEARAGESLQTPPAFSAKRVGGQRAYQRARAGLETKLEPVRVAIHEIDLLEYDAPRVRFEVRVSTGTYVRALARDIGRDLGCGAHLTELRRTRIGPFRVEDAIEPSSLSPATLRPPAWVAPAAALAWMPVRKLDPAEAVAIRHGRPIGRGVLLSGGAPHEAAASSSPGPTGSLSASPEPAAHRPIALLYDGALVGVAEASADDLRPVKVLAPRPSTGDGG